MWKGNQVNFVQAEFVGKTGFCIQARQDVFGKDTQGRLS